MAKYNREFLVSYLRDIYALYVAEKKVNKKYDDSLQNVRNTQLSIGDLPPKPVRDECVYTSNVELLQRLVGFSLVAFSIIILIFALLFFYVVIRYDGIDHIWDAPYIFWTFGVGILLYVTSIPFRKSANKKEREYYAHLKEIKEKYRIQCEQYDQQCLAITEQKKKDIAVFEKESCRWKNEGDRIRNLIDQVYDANIIPMHYRNMYAVVYLYDYFSGSREDDLAMALNTYVLEQIKDRLDRIIENQSEMILNQYTIINNQFKSMEQRELHHAELCRKIDRMNISVEEGNVYLSMLEGHAATLEYFATVDYLNKN